MTLPTVRSIQESALCLDLSSFFPTYLNSAPTVEDMVGLWFHFACVDEFPLLHSDNSLTLIDTIS